ncbi:CU044_5270 family protein [Nocardiopsis halotolerans]|uniref:CU044_5270 family protein n=1 Tax=Nocardiopsis halotolerans TaxID=124252 RepID=UPI00034DEE4F|nr:CU044_5270 family protein [Nocardiopsis halotolerans]
MNRIRTSRDDTDAVRALLSDHDPAADVRADPAGRELARIEVIAAGGGTRRIRGLAPRRPGGRLLLGAAAVLTALAVLGPFGWNAVRPAYAGPPPAPLEASTADPSEGREHLLDLAETAGEQPPPPREGDVAYVHTAEWILAHSVGVDTGEREGWGILPTREEVWRTPRDSGRVVSTPGEPERVHGDRTPFLGLFERGSAEFEWDEGEGGGMSFTWEHEDLSSDPEVLADQLMEGADHGAVGSATVRGQAHSPEGLSDGALLFHALQRLYEEAPVSPGVQAAALRALAAQEDVLYAGTARDREGREGELFLVEEEGVAGTVLERRIMFDSDTGMPLYHETVTVESDTVPDENLPRVNEYTALVDAAWVAGVGDTP